MRSKLTEQLRAVSQWRPGTPSGDRGSLDHYGEQFDDTAKAFRAFARRWKWKVSNTAGEAAGIVVMPWVNTPVPWYSVALAMGLSQRGRPVQLIWDDTGFPDPGGQVEAQDRAIQAVLDDLKPRLLHIRLSECLAEPARPGDAARLAKEAEQNVSWSLRAALADGNERLLGERYRDSLSRTLPLVRSLLRQYRFAYLLVPSGIRGTSCLYRWVGEEKSIRVATYDANLGVVQVATEGIAAQQSDLPRAFQLFLASDMPQAARRSAIAEAQRHLELRIEGRDLARYQAAQPSSAQTAASADVLMPLNVEHDAAALGRHYLFEDTIDWVTSTVAYVLEQPAGSIAVRQHPTERRAHERSRFDLGQVLTDRFGNHPRVHFIAAEAPVNTYDLVANARLILPFVSTIGIEAAALGKPVVVAGNSCYSNLGFVWRPETRPEYFDLVARGLRGALPDLPEQRERAWLCYYLTPVCNRIWTDFTPQPPDFWKWCGQSPAALFATAAIQDILTAIDRDMPAALVRHQRRVSEAAQDGGRSQNGA